ncbi:MAG: carboxypeptidase-like regulatory domain-containing protein [Bacteroidales bacterium]|nr:carboxypeptidase-like regulatory domain-containing protein [Bacteroidales bacterium]
MKWCISGRCTGLTWCSHLFLCAVQWFNPAAWIYARLVRQNHEYLADEEALQRSSDPAVYRAVLLNQIAGSPVIDLGNFFSYSLNKKRFLMMKNKISSPYRKLRVLLILPVAALVLFAFAKPEYRLATGPDEPVSAAIAAGNAVKSVSGTVKDEAGKPLEGAVIVIKGTTKGTTSDASGRFALKDVPDDAVLVVSFVGYETNAISVKAAGTSLSVTMRKSTVVTDTVNVRPVPPPPPPPPPLPPVTTKGKPKQCRNGQSERMCLLWLRRCRSFGRRDGCHDSVDRPTYEVSGAGQEGWNTGHRICRIHSEQGRQGGEC